MGWACGYNGGDKQCIQTFSGENLSKNVHLKTKKEMGGQH
jgi:hypothetical protein